MRQCPSQQKNCYPTQGAAISAALRYSRKRGTPLRPYFHHQCKSWHISKLPAFGGPDSDNLGEERSA